MLGLHTKQKCMCGHYSYWMQCRLARSSRMDKHLADQDLFKINVGLGTIYEIMLTVRARFLLIGPINWPSVWSFIIPNICWNKFVLLFLDDFFIDLFFYHRKRPVLIVTLILMVFWGVFLIKKKIYFMCNILWPFWMKYYLALSNRIT